jgi:hypothetical protein
MLATAFAKMEGPGGGNQSHLLLKPDYLHISQGMHSPSFLFRGKLLRELLRQEAAVARSA